MNFGILGSGNMARVYGDALTREGVVPNGPRRHRAGLRAPALAAEYPGVDAEPSAEALLARQDIDVVVIATPHSTHLALAKQVAAAGKHIYLEKPMALDVNECDADHRRLSRGRRPADDREADPAHGNVDARQGAHRQGRIGDILFLRPTQRHARARAS